MLPDSANAVELACAAQAVLGEGPIWDPTCSCLYWVDILGSRLHAFDPATGDDRGWAVGDHVGAVVPRARGGVVLALRDHLATFDPKRAGTPPKLLAKPGDHPAGNRFNDGKCDPAGRLWVGTMAYDNAHGAGTLWRFDADGTATAMLRGVTISNGLAWDLPRRRFYYIDSSTRTIVVFAYDHETGTITGPRVAVACSHDDGFPDGMSIDEDGLVWVAHWGNHQVIRWDPDTGMAARRIHLPVSQPSACAFGGEHLDRLYITSARVDLDPAQLAAQPLAGGLFVIDPGVRGRASVAFTG